MVWCTLYKPQQEIKHATNEESLNEYQHILLGYLLFKMFFFQGSTIFSVSMN